jgi:serine/threonine protein kinase/tetratricopeptide (TPR) repeat protein
MNEQTIFTAALGRQPGERSTFLDEVCGTDPGLRQRIEKLLRLHADAGSFLESPAGDSSPTIDHPPLEQPGTQIGPYKLLEQIGEGGMGVVYHASQREPIRRTVALKIIKPGMDTREVVKRFEAERQALAMMEHPNIAKVFDGGVTDAGRPYFAMELVKGTPITEYCDRAQLSTRERLALFVTLCHGVQHAHQKGVIHRDLKPSNLLVEVHDVRPVPKIIDFGIAKAMGQQLSEQSLHTAFDQMVGTPLYMSPEQAGQSCKDVDTRSDIYSLGVVLYELLTGQTPFERDTLRTAGVDEMRRIIREVDPPRPSARVSTLQAADLSTISERRHVEPGKLSQQLRGELDWIVMKALDKDRDRRYATVNDLAADVDRYLSDEPVQACPPSVTYRFAKFARRNQVALVTSALFALLLIVGTGVSVWQAVRATNAEVTAIAERDEKEQQTQRATRAELAALADRDANKQLALRATNAEQQTAQALLTAQERLQFGRQAVDEMYTQVAEKWLAQQAELTVVQKQFLEKALAFYQRLATEQSDDPAVRFETAKALQRVGEIQKKLGQHKEAEASYRQARELLQQLVREKPDEPQYRDWLAQAQSMLGGLLSFTGRLPEAEQELRSALEICQTLAAQFPGDAQYQEALAKRHEGLARLFAVTGRPREAEAAYRQSIALYASALTNTPDDPDRRLNLARSQDALASRVRVDKPEEAEALHHGAIDATTALLADDPKNVDYRMLLAASHNNLGLVFQQLGRPLEAEASFRQALSMFQELAAELPTVPHYRYQQAINLDNLVGILGAAGKDVEAEQLASQSRDIMEKLAADYPEVPEYRFRIAFYLNNFADTLMDAGNWAEARQLRERALVHQKAAMEPDSLYTADQEWLYLELNSLMEVQVALGDQAAAARTAEDFVQLDNTPRPANLPGHAMLRSEELLKKVLKDEMAEGMQRPDSPVKQRREFESAAHVLLIKAFIQDAAQQSVDDPDQYHLVSFLTTAPEHLRDADLALKTARRAVELKPGDATCLQALGWALYRTGDFRGSIETLNKAGTSDTFVHAMAHWQLGEKAEARTAFDACSEWLQGYEQRCEEELKQGITQVPLPVQLKRLQAEAAAMLGVTIPTAETAPEPAAKEEEAKEQPKSTPAPEAAKEEEESK